MCLLAGVAMAVASLTACGSGRTAATKESTAKRVSSPGGTTASGRSDVTFTTAGPLVVGPPLAGGHDGATDSTTTVSNPSVTPGTASAVTVATTVAPSVRPAPSASPACAARDLRVSFDLQPAGGTQPPDRTRALIVLTDMAAGTCTLQGYAAIDAVEADHWRSLDLHHVAPSTAPGPVLLESGGSAFAGMEWTAVEGCPEVAAFRLTLPEPGAALPVVIAVPGGEGSPVVVCAADAELGPFSPTSQGTVDFPDSAGAGT